MKRTKLKDTRPKAFLGALIPAGISLAGSIINGIGTARQAKSEADAIEEQSRMQADMIKSINENNNRLQERLIASNKEQNQRMVNAYLNSAIQQGALNVDSRYRAGRIQVAKGGRLGANRSSLLRGLNNNVEVEGGELIITPNIPPQATDGGQIIPIGQTEDGNVISIAVGPSHEQKHPSINGKREGGVGINVNDETMILSRHTHNGFNPVEAVAQGMAPEDAFQIQENNKIMDKVDYKTPVGRRRLRYGGRPKAADGDRVYIPRMPYLDITDIYGYNNNLHPQVTNNMQTINPPNVKRIVRRDPDYHNPFWNTPLGATAITGAGNLLGWGATAIGNAIAAQHQKRGVNRAADAMVNAYNQLRGVDLNQLNGVYNHGIAALQDASTINAGAERAAIERSLQRNLRGINRGRLSSAAAQNLSATAETNAQDLINQAEAEAAKRRQVVANENQQAINDMTKTNLSIDAQRAQNINDLLKYNSEVANERLLGIGTTEADMHKTLGEIRGRRSLAGWNGAANMFTNTTQTYQNQLNNYNQNLFNLLSAIAGSINEASAKRSLNIGSYFYPSLRNIYNNLV